MRDQDAELGRAFVNVLRAMVAGTVPADAEPVVRERGAEVFEAIDCRQ